MLGSPAVIAEQRGTTMLDVVADAIHRLSRDEWWDTVRSSLDQMSDDETAAYRRDTEAFDAAAGDGIHAH